MSKNLLLAQSGGPTAAINATAAGVIEAAMANPEVDKIYAGFHGIQGVLDDNLIDVTERINDLYDVATLCGTPGAAFGSCRLKLKDMEKNAEEFKKIVEVLRKREIAYFVYIGGNDSMDTVDKLSAYCKAQEITDITVVGAPKTVDNDLVLTDHTPGFGSAAKYIAVTAAELERDARVYPAKQVTILEVMGRDAGWLTAASALARANGASGPDLIYLCERPFDIDKFIADIEEVFTKKTSVLVAISEGIHDKDGNYISEMGGELKKDNFGHSYIAGSAKVLCDIVGEKLGVKTRAIVPDYLQRCAGHIQSKTDIEESRMLGFTAAKAALKGDNGVMAAVIVDNRSPYTVHYETVPVSKVANAVKSVPDDYIAENGHDITQKMWDYLFPLIQGEPAIEYKNGIPVHSIFY